MELARKLTALKHAEGHLGWVKLDIAPLGDDIVKQGRQLVMDRGLQGLALAWIIVLSFLIRCCLTLTCLE